MDAALAGVPTDFRANGVTYKVMPRTLGDECLFETWLQEIAYDTIVRHHNDGKGRLDAANFAAAREGWVQDCAAGVYEWGGLAAWRRATTPSGQRRLLFLKICAGTQPPHCGPAISEATLADLARADPAAWQRLLDVMDAQDYEPERREREKAKKAAAGPNGAAGAAAQAAAP